MFFKCIKTLLFLFLFAYMRLVLFVRVKSFCRKKNFKIALMTSFTLLLSVLFVVEKLKAYINFSDQDLCQLEAEFLSLQSI